MTYAETLDKMKVVLKDLVPAAEMAVKADLAVRINELKARKKAVILGHNYMEPALYHFITDYRGDSLELSRRAAEAVADIIVFCGVRFMAETAKILNPTRKVLVPAYKAGCSLAESVSAQDVRALKARFPGVPVVTYINTYAEVKAESDICCTSGNAEKVVRSLGSDTVIFIPDEYLAANVARQTGKRIVSAKPVGDRAAPPAGSIVSWNGRCEVHERFTVGDIETVRSQYPDVAVLSHPECSPEVVGASDFSGSTKEMIDFIKANEGRRYLLLTECSMADNVIASSREDRVLRLCSIRCPHMGLITLEDTLAALEQERYEIEVPEDIRSRAKVAIDRMLAI
jgi:quinolinate synthase